MALADTRSSNVSFLTSARSCISETAKNGAAIRRASSSASCAGGSGDVRTPSPDWLIATPYLSVVCSFATSSARNVVCVCLTFPATFGSRLCLSERADEITRAVRCFCLTTSRRASRREVKGLTGEVSRGAEVCLLRTESERVSVRKFPPKYFFPPFVCGETPHSLTASAGWRS